MVNAGDWNQVRKIGGEILRDGWKCRGTWRLLLFPLLGDRIIKTGVAFKSGFRSKST
jgi:hypothetical protein